MAQEDLNKTPVGTKYTVDGDLHMVAPCVHGPIKGQSNPRYFIHKSYHDGPFDPSINKGISPTVDIVNTEWWLMEEYGEWHCLLGISDNPRPVLAPVGLGRRNQCPFGQTCKMSTSEAHERGLA